MEDLFILRKSCCSGKVDGRFTLDGLKKEFGYGGDDTIKDINDLERRLVSDYKGFDVPYYIEKVCEIE